MPFIPSPSLLVKSSVSWGDDPGSEGSNETIALSIKAASSTVRVIGPTVSMVQLKGNTPLRLTLPNVGFSPTIPQRAEGILIEPPVSVPREAMHCPAATEEADPPLDPPVIRSVSQGFRAGPS